LWTKVKNNISIIRQTHDGPAPRSSSQHYSSSSRSRSHSRSPSRPPTSSHHRSASTGSPRAPFQERRSASASSPRSPSSSRPYVSISTNGGAPQAVYSPGQYGSTYIVTSPAPSPVVYQSFPPSPASTTPNYFSPASTSRPGAATRRTTAPMSSSRTPTSSSSRSPSSTPRGPPAPTRSNTAPLARPSNGTDGIMYNGKLIVGDPDEVEKYISTQKRIENWCREVK
jgi:hypothetical protein